MKVADLLESRRAQWRELEQLCDQTNHWWRKRMSAADILRFSNLYRSACADLALADAYQLPPATIEYLHQLVGRAHNQLYRGEALTFRGWFHELFVVVPQRLRADRCLWLAAGIFWGLFMLTAVMGYNSRDFAERVLSKEQMMGLEEMYSKPVERSLADGGAQGSAMGGFYIYNNCGIGLQCFAFGLLLGIGGLYETIFNAIVLGTVFGFMARSPSSDNFFQFVTAHGPFELTAIVLCAAAGMRLGFSVIATHGMTRIASLRRAGKEAMSTVWTALVLFVFAAAIEGFVSPSSMPYAIKAAVGIISCILLLVYFLVLGRGKR
jgi:uncharacterized membrane protein SpoIIM required for sporulation